MRASIADHWSSVSAQVSTIGDASKRTYHLELAESVILPVFIMEIQVYVKCHISYVILNNINLDVINIVAHRIAKFGSSERKLDIFSALENEILSTYVFIALIWENSANL